MVGVVFCLVLVCMVYGDNSPVDLDSSGDCADSEDCDVQPKFIVNKKEKYILAVGSKLELKCSLKGGCYESTELDINKLKIIHCKSSSMCSVKDTTVVDNNVCMISFTEDNVTLQDMGTYFCQYNEVNKTRDNIYIRTGYIPFGPQDISCVSNDLENLICNWTMSKEDRNNDIPVDYKSYFKASNLSGQFECQDVEICSLPPLGTGNGGISFNLPNKYTLYINAYNEVGRRLVEYPIDFAKVVKLSPPLVSLNMLEDKSLTLTVKQESEIPLIWIEAIVYQVDYHCSYRSPEMKEVITSENINNVKLTNLIPYTRYTVMVKNKGLNSTGEIYWTSAQPEFYRTKPAAPHSVPSVCGYSIVDDHINIYILPIKKWEKYSKNAAYVVNFTTGSVIDKTFNVSWDIFTIENITSSSGTGFLLELRTVNDVGHSKNTSSLVVPPYETDKLVPMNVIVEGSGKVYNVYWDTVTNDMEKIDVYWCVGQGSKCEGDLNWMSVLPNITKTKVNTDTVDKWIFAVSFVYNDGYTTEMVFSQCYFPDIDKAPNRVVVYSVIPKTRQILVKPGEYCSKKYPSKPLFYHVYYKHSQKDIKLCDQSFFQKRVKATMSKGEITLDKLSPGIDYYICMAVISSGGSSSISEPEKVQTLPEAENTFKEMIILVVICSAIGTIIVFFIAWKLVKKYKDEDPVIEVPKINTNQAYERVPVNENDEKSVSEKRSDKFTREQSDDSGVPPSIETSSLFGSTHVEDELSQNTGNKKPSNDLPGKHQLEYIASDTNKSINDAWTRISDGVSDVFPNDYVSGHVTEHNQNNVAECGGVNSLKVKDTSYSRSRSSSDPISSYVKEEIKENKNNEDRLNTNNDYVSRYVCQGLETDQYFQKSPEAVPFVREGAELSPYISQDCKTAPYVKENAEPSPYIREDRGAMEGFGELFPSMREGTEAASYVRESLNAFPYRKQGHEKAPLRESLNTSCLVSCPLIGDSFDETPYIKEGSMKEDFKSTLQIQESHISRLFGHQGLHPGRNVCKNKPNIQSDKIGIDGLERNTESQRKHLVHNGDYVENTKIFPCIDVVEDDLKQASDWSDCHTNLLDKGQVVIPLTAFSTLSKTMNIETPPNSFQSSGSSKPQNNGYVVVDDDNNVIVKRSKMD